MIKKVVKKLSKIKKIFLLFLIIPFCVIIGLLIKSYADDNLNTRPVSYDIGSTVHYVFDFFTDSIKFHIRANGYENVLSQDSDDNFASIVESGSSKMQGYGNYVMKADTSLFSFIEWCHNKNAYYTEACAITPSDNPERACDYNKLMSYKGQVIAGTSKQYMNTFWQNMTNLLGDTFKQYQDSYFFEKYTYKATQQIGINLAKLRSYVNNDEYSVKEYLTCLTSYMFSYEKEAAPDTMEVKKGDVVPFLYYKRNVDEDDPQEIAKYAYVALIEGWVTGINGTHLWENEYQYLYGSYDPDDLDWDLETLEAWYSECYDKYKGSKGRKGNNLLGSDIETIIQSDYSVSQQLEATEHYLNQVFAELGIETNFKETMARNELMAKYMMENSNFSETIKDYNDTIDFMTENIQRGTSEEKNTHTAVLSDFQVIELNHTLNVDGQSDGDGISDKTELGPIKWVDITEFVRKAYEDAVRSGASHRATFEEQVDDIIYANGGFYNDITGNYIDGSVKWADNRKLKVLYRTYDYRSNPLLNDTDFDGINDNTDSKPIDNRFTGTSTDIGKVEYNNDFRWFFTDKTKYNDELAVMSLIASNLANGNTVSTNQASGNITTYMQTLGFTDIRNIGDTVGDVYIGKKTIDYYGNKKDVIAVFIGNCDTVLNYKAVLKFKEDEIGNIRTNTLLHYMNNTVDDLAKQIVDKINIASSNEKCYWVSGYGLAGSIATEVSDRLIRSDSGSNEVYSYTFGATNTRDKSSDTNAEIKNIINQDDLSVRFITGGKAGEDYGLSIAEDLTNEYRDITGSNNYKGNYLYTNYIVDIYNKMDTLNIPANVVTNMKTSLATYLVNYNKITNREVIDNYNDLVIAANKWAEGNRQAHSIKSYYVLAKSLNGFDLLDGDSEKQEKYNKIVKTASKSDDDIIEGFTNTKWTISGALEKIANWYVNHVFTYQGKKKYDDFGSFSLGVNVSNYKMYMLGTGTEKRIEFFKTSGVNDTVTGGNYSILIDKNGADATIEKKDSAGIKTTYYFKRMAETLDKFVYDAICYIRASSTACEKNHEYKKKDGSVLNYYLDCEELKGYQYKDVGDDCARFAFAVLELGTGEEAKNLVNTSDDASQFAKDTNSLKETLRNQFDIYTGTAMIAEFNKGLKNGDMLVSKYGDGESESRKNTRNHAEFVYNNTLSPIGVFGWGNVKKTTDSRARFVVKLNKYILNNEDGTYYSVLLRQKGAN